MPTRIAISAVIGERLVAPRMPSVPKYLRAIWSSPENVMPGLSPHPPCRKTMNGGFCRSVGAGTSPA